METGSGVLQILQRVTESVATEHAVGSPEQQQGQGYNNNFNGDQVRAGDVLSQALGQQLGAATAALLERNLSIAPTLKILPGYRFDILVVKDLTFDRPYVVPNY